MKKKLLSILILLVTFLSLNIRIVSAQEDDEINNNNNIVDDNNNDGILNDNDGNTNDDINNNNDGINDNNDGMLEDDMDDDDLVENIAYGLGGLIIGGLVSYLAFHRRDER